MSRRRSEEDEEELDDFDGPVNDVYPYRDEVNPPQNDRRLARDAQEEQYGDFFDQRGPDGSDFAAFVDDDRPMDYVRRQRRHKARPRTCSDALEDSDFAVPELWNSTNPNDEFNDCLAEFYNEQTHDILGMQHDIIADDRQNTQTCKKTKRFLKLGRLLSRKPTKRKKAIKVNVFDGSRIVKQIDQNAADNSLTIHIRHKLTPMTTMTTAAVTTPVYSTTTTSTMSPPRSAKSLQKDTYFDDANTLKRIENILSADTTALRGDWRIPMPDVSFKDTKNMVFAVNNRRVPYESHAPTTQRSPPEANSVHNKLEDLTEPTSAAEQRALGSTDKFNMFPMVEVTTTSVGHLFMLPAKHDVRIKRRENTAAQFSKAFAFRSRKLFAVDGGAEYTDNGDYSEESDRNEEDPDDADDVNSRLRTKKNLRSRLGMNRDEDYSEDRPHVTCGKQTHHNRRVGHQPSAVRHKRKHKPFQVNLVSTPEEKRALQNRLAMTVGSKVKKSSAGSHITSAPLDVPLRRKKKRGADVLPYSDHAEPEDETQSEDIKMRPQMLMSHSQNDRCCENTNSDSKSKAEEKPNSGEGANQTSNQETFESSLANSFNSNESRLCGNQSGELQIFEKTQAIVLQITGSPMPATTITTEAHSGWEDDTDDSERMFTKNDGNVMEEFKRRGNDVRTEKAVTHSSEDVVSELFKLVDKYKDHVNVNSKSKLTAKPTWGFLHATTPLTADDKRMRKEEISMLHAGHGGAGGLHPKKLHPKNTGNCTIDMPQDEGTSNHPVGRVDDVTNPSIPVEQYYKPEVVAEEWASGDQLHSKQKRETEDEPFDDDVQQFTPDSMEAFKDYDDFEPATRSTASDEKVKRHSNDQDGYNNDQEIDKLLTMINDAGQTYYPPLRHHRFRDQLLDPDEDTLLVKREQATEIVPLTTGMVSSSTGTPQFSDSPTTMSTVLYTATSTEKMPKCEEVEEQKAPSGPCGKSHSNTDNDWQEFQAMNEYGEAKHYADRPKMSKSSRLEEARLRMNNIAKIDRDRKIVNDHDDERIRNMINGQITLDIIDKFHTRLKDHPRLSERFGQSNTQKCAHDEMDQMNEYREAQCMLDVKHAQLMLHQVIAMLNKIVTEQVHRRTCLIPSPALKSHLRRIIAVAPSSKSASVAEGYPLPALHDSSGRNRPIEPQSGFLFGEHMPEKKAKTRMQEQLELKKKMAMIKNLIRKYNSMTSMCQVKVEPVRTYLKGQLHTLERMISEHVPEEASEECEVKCLPKSQNHNISTSTTTTATESSSSTSSTTSNEVVTQVFSSTEKVVGRSAEEFFQYPLRRYARRYKNVAQEEVEEDESDRRKRQIEHRLERLFGHRKRDDTTMGTIEETENERMAHAPFETPLVYTLE